MTEENRDAEVRREIRRLTRRGFVGGALAAGAVVAGWNWLGDTARVEGAQWPLRRILNMNETLARAYFDHDRLSPTFPPDEVVRVPRINGHQGLVQAFDVSQWRLRIEGAANSEGPVELTMEDIRTLPRQEMIYQIRCIEGWSMIVKWTGVRFADLVRKIPPPTRSGRPLDLENRPDDLPPYIAMSTPDGGYYVGLDAASAIHPQSLLVYEMNDLPIDWHHGSPLRLSIPVKYGIKNIKRIGTVRYTDVRPPDFWSERGYDWYAGL